MRSFVFLFVTVLVLAVQTSLPAAVTGQWDFDSGNLSATVGAPLAYRGTTAATTAFTTATIGGQTANVMSFPATTSTQGYIMTHGIAPNGGGAYVNQYTLIMDVMFPTASSGQWRALFQTNPDNSNDSDLFVNPANSIGISGEYHGTVQPNTWHRLAFVVDLTAPSDKLRKYIDGVLVGTQDTGFTLDGRWSLLPTALLFADEDNETRGGFVNSIQIRSEAMLTADIAALGGPSADGIPLPAPPSSLRVVSPNGGENYQAGTAQSVSWTVIQPNSLAQVDLLREGVLFQTLAQVPLAQSNYVWTISPWLGDTNNYRIRVTAADYPAVTDSSDGSFSVFGSIPGPNPLFGQPLQVNGGFESLFSNWQTVAGNPLILNNAGGKGSPHSGVNFFHGGINTTASNAIVRQDIDLIATGFTPDDLDAGAVLDATAWLRNFYGAGNFDDQVFCRIGYLDDSGAELSAMRCIIAGDSVWVQRNLSGLLPAGTRALRVEIIGKHRRDADNDSMADDVTVRLQKAFPLPTPKITKLPMLQDVRPNAMTLFWETDGNLARHFVDWGRSNIAENTFSQIETLQIDDSHFVHRATLAGLEVETSYVYRVRSGTNVTATYSFRTAPKPSTPFVAAWWGDNHGGTAILRQHVTNLLTHAPNLICVAGDMVNSGNAISEWNDYWFKPLETLNAAQTIPVIYARGNHDGEHALAYAYSALPGNEAWFAFDYGNSRFIFLDSEVTTSTSIDQYNWLQTELSRPETQRAAFRIVCFHRPPYVNVWNGGGYTGEAFVRNDWVPLFTQKNVDLVISGHMHAYQRGASNGVMYVVSGGGGGTVDTEVVADWPLVEIEHNLHHFDIMRVNGPTLSWETYNTSNLPLDLFSLHSRLPTLSWQSNTPVGGTLTLVVSGKPGVSYVVESSANLADWSPLATNTIPLAGPPTFTTSVPATGSQRLIRARIGP
ncbi:MAG TPA: metallophosphoesterase family protein [Verrucomicrobiae bacterium]|nr:metallophosphoesterase family protein [Verrucomicrobiae bacterium]